MFANLPRNRSKTDLALIAVLLVALAAFSARLIVGPSAPTAPHDQRASVEAPCLPHS